MTQPTLVEPLLESMRFRCIGPPRGGRVVAVAGHPTELAVFYFGAVAGGIWKTEDAGTTWRNVSDGYLQTSSVGALAVSEYDPKVIYAGMGESTIRNDVSHGDGVYRSSDSGRTWVHLGLAETRHISEIRVHPKNPDVVYVAAQGHAFGPNRQRGVFRSTDGGANWEHVLYKSENAGAADLSVDPANPVILYASLWEARRSFWSMSSGGPGCGLWKSADGGDSWTEITRNKGLPADGLLGKMGVSASPARAGRVWALIEASAGAGLYLSDDFGETWKLCSDKQDLRYRPWYYMHVFADSCDADTVYVTNLAMWRSTDGGATFTSIATPHGDNHDLWIDPRDNRRMIEGNDGGATVSFNAGASRSSVDNQCTAQFYTVTTDTQAPHYRVYGTQQDNSSISVPSNSIDGAITLADCYLAGTGESGFMAVHPADPNIVYIGAVGSSPGGGGALQRYDHRTGQIQLVNVWPEPHGGIGPGELRHRFAWTYPILFSCHDPSVLYAAGNVVFRSTDEGHSWSAISPDLSRDDAGKLVASGGPITKDTSGAEHYCTVSSLRESPLEKDVLWAGTDDGLVHISRDGANTWQNVTPPDLPAWTFVRTVEPSYHDPATLYLAATGYKQCDPEPYVYRTMDYGVSWERIAGDGELSIPR
ncbi:MAG: WD40/YVTN/BNR-like repeat-containing protein, partial [Gammaproteobacteria bacterium]